MSGTAGLPADRVALPYDPADDRAYLARFAAIDILLDPGSYSGVTTTCEGAAAGGRR